MERETIALVLIASAATNALLATILCLAGMVMAPTPTVALTATIAGAFVYALAVCCAIASEALPCEVPA